MSQSDIIIKTPKQIEEIREAGKYLTELLHLLHSKATAGTALIELEFVAEHFLKSHNLKGPFKNYNGFPANVCWSVNDCVVHGEPTDYLLKNGDLLKIDAGVQYQKGIADSAISVIIGGELANPLGYDLAKVTKEALDVAVTTIEPKKPMFEYGHAVENYVKNHDYKILKYLTGHGVGVKVHEKPYIYNYANPQLKKLIFQPGMVLAFEPITAVMSDDFYQKPGDEGLYTQHGDLGAQWEYTILITEKGYEILSGVEEWL